MIRPHVQKEIDATRAAMARLRLAVERAAGPKRQAARTPEEKLAGEMARALDEAYAAATGRPLDLKTAPEYPRGPWREQPTTRNIWRGIAKEAIRPDVLRNRALGALKRLREGQPGCKPRIAAMIIEYFDAIWPEGAAWPETVPRPRLADHLAKPGEAAP